MPRAPPVWQATPTRRRRTARQRSRRGRSPAGSLTGFSGEEFFRTCRGPGAPPIQSATSAPVHRCWRTPPTARGEVPGCFARARLPPAGRSAPPTPDGTRRTTASVACNARSAGCVRLRLSCGLLPGERPGVCAGDARVLVNLPEEWAQRNHGCMESCWRPFLWPVAFGSGPWFPPQPG